MTTIWKQSRQRGQWSPRFVFVACLALIAMFPLIMILIVGHDWIFGNDQQIAIQQIESLGGKVVIGPGTQKPLGSEWLRRITGYRIPNASEAQSVSFDGTLIQDSDLICLRKLPTLRSVSLNSTKIRGDGLAVLKNLNKVKKLSVRDTMISDAALTFLENLSDLESLELDGTSITDDGLEHLQSLSNLKILSFSNTAISDAGIAKLAAIPGLVGLGMARTKVSDAGLLQLQD